MGELLVSGRVSTVSSEVLLFIAIYKHPHVAPTAEERELPSCEEDCGFDTEARKDPPKQSTGKRNLELQSDVVLGVRLFFGKADGTIRSSFEITSYTGPCLVMSK